MVLEVLCYGDCNQDNLRFRHLCTSITAMIEALHQRVNQDKGGYNPVASIGSSRYDDSVGTIILAEESMGVNEQSSSSLLVCFSPSRREMHLGQETAAIFCSADDPLTFLVNSECLTRGVQIGAWQTRLQENHADA